MGNIFRWLLRIVSGLIVLGLAALWIGYLLAARSLPDYDATHTVEGLTGTVEIVRDNANVPHVFGAADSDVYFGLGFAHAQDRLWQIMLMRRTAQGNLSELFGARMLATDELMRRLAIYRAAQESLAVQDEATREALDAYAAGVNAWLAQVNADARGRGAPEFFLFPAQIAPWQAADSIALLKLMAVQNARHLGAEVLRARASLVLPEARLRDLLPDAPGAGVAALPDYAALFPQAVDTPDRRTAALPLSGIAMAPFGAASNVWAAGPARAAAGGSLLANDPHMAFSAPGPLYLARLELSSGGVIGASIPGIPAIVSGRKAGLGWGFSASSLDDLDVHIERLAPEDPAVVETPAGPRALEARGSIIRVRDGEPVTIELQWSENGPILPGKFFDLATITPPGHITSVAWTALAPDDRSISALIALMQADTVADGLRATDGYVAPSVNLVLADADDIALRMIGRAPRRDPAHQSQGRIPAPGWIAANRWQGTRPASELPEIVNPEGSLLGNTNNKVLDAPFPDHLSHFWGDTQRVQRWRRLMQNREVHTRESFIEAQNDIVSFSARSLLPLVAADLWFTGEAAPEGTPERQRQRALALLAEWNGEMNEHLPEPLLYYAWMRSLQDRLIRDELGPLARAFTHVEPIFIERVFRDIGGAAAWCDVIQSAPVETCTDIARQSLDDALIWVGETYGTALESLRWGDAHVATNDHTVLGDTPFLKWIVNIRQSTSGGDNTLQRGLTRGTAPEPFANVHGAVYRGVYDFADPESSVFITTAGQSGHFLSRHYEDLGELWRRGEYVPMALDPDLARAGAVGVTTLVPR